MNRPSETVDTLYFGGGTPSLAPIDVLQETIRLFDLIPGAEVTLEVNPDHITSTILNQWKSIGINRLSLGIQSLESEVLKMMLRQHTPDEALEKLKEVKERGFQNVNVDLILGYPKQSGAIFLQDLQRLVDLHPDHFSIYLLELHESAPL